MIPTITLPPTTRETRWVSVDDLRFFVKELCAVPSDNLHQLALGELRELCDVWEPAREVGDESSR